MERRRRKKEKKKKKKEKEKKNERKKKKRKKERKKERKINKKQTNKQQQQTKESLHEVYSEQRDMVYLCQLRSAPTGEFLREVSSALRYAQFCSVHTGEFYMMYLVHSEPCFMPVMWFTNGEFYVKFLVIKET